VAVCAALAGCGRRQTVTKSKQQKRCAGEHRGRDGLRGKLRDDALPRKRVGRVDGKRAFAHVAKQVGFWARDLRVRPRLGNAGVHSVRVWRLRLQGGDGIIVYADTPGGPGSLPIEEYRGKKIPTLQAGNFIIRLATHYDTKAAGKFVWSG